MAPRIRRIIRKDRSDNPIASTDSVGTSNGSAEEQHTRVEECAYRLYEQRGRQDGHDLDDWLTAEQQILAAEQADHAN
jgi:hypothetical protein